MSEHKSAPQISKFFRFPLLVFVSFLSLLIINSSLLIKVARAANAIPSPAPIPCDPELVDDPEYSSDRPYQASPCTSGEGGGHITLWCGNNIVLVLGKVKVSYCDKANGSATSCPADITKEQKIDIDLTNVELPILGNTNDTKSSQSQDEIDDGEKVNNYVAWYLGGVNNKAESATNPKTAEGLSKIVDFSGPVKKLLPSVIQESTRSAVIKSSTDQVTYVDEETNETVTEANTHNQIVVCGKEGEGGFFGWIQNVLNLGKTNPVDCYTGKGSGSQETAYRLKDWQGELSWWNNVANSVATIVNAMANLFPLIPRGIIEQSVGDHWNSRLPPLPWCDKDCKPFANDALYQKAYNEWKGKTCILIPGVNLVMCVDNIFVPNKYADLFQYVPLANTVDKKGAHTAQNAHIDAPLATLDQTDYSIIHSPQLYVAHSVENYQLSSLLKSTYLSADATGSSILSDVEKNLSPTCRIIPSRSNPGDDVTFDNPKSHVEVDVKYHVSEIQCKNITRVCDDPPTCSSFHYTAECSSEVYATIATVSKTPFADEIWSNTVAGNDSIFRRIYPKTGEGSPVSCIADNPAQSKATYTVNRGTSDKDVKLWRIIEPDDSSITGEGGTDGSDKIDAQLYYPHYGGVLDYFLNGIQTALRPKGFGSPVVNGTMCEAEAVNATCPSVADSAVPEKYLGAFKSRFIGLADSWTTSCPGPDNNLAEECYNYVVSESQKNGVNPAFSLTMWLEESDASNYCYLTKLSGDPKVGQDFGMNVLIPGTSTPDPEYQLNIVKQLEKFLDFSKQKLCDASSFIEPMHAWLSRFRATDFQNLCDPTNQCGIAYTYGGVCNNNGTDTTYGGIINVWNWVTGDCIKNVGGANRFILDWPTDMSCPT